MKFSTTYCQALVLAAALSPSPMFGQSTEPLETDCLLMVLDQVELAARRDGVLEKLHVRTGDEVQRDQLVFELGKREASANLDVATAKHAQAKAKAENMANIKAAEVELERSTQEVSLLDEVGRVPYLERFRAKNTKDKNKAELDIARMTHLEDIHAAQVADAELSVARIDVDDRKVYSPIEGSIVKQIKFEGDWCNRGDPILKILRMDRLVLQGIVNVKNVAPNQVVGMKATATFELAGEEPVVLSGLTIKKVSPEVDLDGNYLIWTFVENRKASTGSGGMLWLFRPGISGILKIEQARTPRANGNVATR